MTAAVFATALAGCGPAATHTAFQPGETWTDEHGNRCRAETAYLAACVTPDGHAFTMETKPAPGSLASDPVKAIMYGVSTLRGPAKSEP